MNQEYLDTFNASPEEAERYELQEKIKSLCVPHYAEKILKIAQEIVDCPPENLENLLEVSSKMTDISNEVKGFSEFLGKLD